MKNTLYTLSIFSVLTLGLFACKDNPPVLEKPPCSVISEFDIVQEGATVKFTWQSNLKPAEYQISYGLVADSITPGETEKELQTENENSLEKTILEVGIPIDQQAVFYIRGFCIGSDGDWFGPIYFTPKAYCTEPFDLVANTDGQGAAWSSNTDAKLFEYEYGKKGFALGTGIKIETSRGYTSDLILYKDTAYDLYLRANCQGTLGYSDWAGPIQLIPDDFVNLCPPPKDVKMEVDDQGAKILAKPTWETYGETTFLIVFVPKGYDPTWTSSMRISTSSGFPIIPLNKMSYDFYVRAECYFNPPDLSDWTGPIAVNH